MIFSSGVNFRQPSWKVEGNLYFSFSLYEEVAKSGTTHRGPRSRQPITDCTFFLQEDVRAVSPRPRRGFVFQGYLGVRVVIAFPSPNSVFSSWVSSIPGQLHLHHFYTFFLSDNTSERQGDAGHPGPLSASLHTLSLQPIPNVSNSPSPNHTRPCSFPSKFSFPRFQLGQRHHQLPALSEAHGSGIPLLPSPSVPLLRPQTLHHPPLPIPDA